MATTETNILFASSECVPFASTGGLGDVVDALPRILHGKDGIQTFRVLPMYRRIKESETLRFKKNPTAFAVPIGLEQWAGRIWELQAKKGPRTFLIEREELFDRSELYGPTHRPYDDNFERFLFFQKGVIALIDQLKLEIDLVHCNDWQTGLIPLLLKYGVDGRGRHHHKNTKTIFTIHNLAYQGVFPPHLFGLTNLPLEVFHFERLEYYNQLNCLKGGLAETDFITTVSKTYAQEIQTAELGCGLDKLIAHRADRLTGIVNGVDYSTWNPSKDTYLAHNFSPTKMAGKKASKAKLQEKFGLPVCEKTPLIGMVSRLAEQKGFEIIHESMKGIIETGAQVVLLGSGDPTIEKNAKSWAKKWPTQCAVEIGFDQALAHQIEAGADMFLMPSRFEPCGLNQLYSLKYGTIPLVNDTGGLSDTIIDLTQDPENGTGFKMSAYESRALVDMTQRATALYENKTSWKAAVKRAMTSDFSWETTSGEYLELYRRVLESDQPKT